MINEEAECSTEVGRGYRWQSSLVLAAILLPLLYVVSSGPLLVVAVQHNLTTSTDASGRVIAIDDADVSEWWPNAYTPLVWVSDQSWGEPLQWYWEWFASLDLG